MRGYIPKSSWACAWRRATGLSSGLNILRQMCKGRLCLLPVSPSRGHPLSVRHTPTCQTASWRWRWEAYPKWLIAIIKNTSSVKQHLSYCLKDRKFGGNTATEESFHKLNCPKDWLVPFQGQRCCIALYHNFTVGQLEKSLCCAFLLVVQVWVLEPVSKCEYTYSSGECWPTNAGNCAL